MTPFAETGRARALAGLATTAAIALSAPALAQGAKLSVDPVQRCYREQQTVQLPGSGFTPNAEIDFTRDGTPVVADPPIMADAAGGLDASLTLPGLLSSQRRLTYLATDSSDPAISAELSLLVTAIHVSLKPRDAAPNGRLRIRARGFFGHRHLWAHVVRRGGKRSRNLRIGRVRGPCGKVATKRRIFPADAAPGRYRVQFDGFRRYRRSREVQAPFKVTIMGTAAAGAAATRIR